MKKYSASCLIAFCAACATGTCFASEPRFLSERNSWSEDFTRLSQPTPECPGGSLAALKIRMDLIGPHTPASFEQMVAHATPEDQEAGTTTLFPYAVSAFVKERLKDSDRIHAFDFTTDPGRFPWWAFHGILVTDGDCIIHVEVGGYDHG